MADFPTTIYEARDTENLPGIVFDPTNKRNMYSEDFQAQGAEITAIETYLKNDIIPNQVMHRKIGLVASEIRALHDTPKVLISAPGQDYVIMVLSAMINYQHVSSAFSNPAPIHIAYAESPDLYFLKSENFLGVSEDNYSYFTPYQNAISTIWSEDSVVLSCPNIMTGGAGVLDIDIVYMIINL